MRTQAVRIDDDMLTVIDETQIVGGEVTPDSATSPKPRAGAAAAPYELTRFFGERAFATGFAVRTWHRYAFEKRAVCAP
jgi:hypothetical protein